MALEVGTEAPDFTLRDANREEVALSSFRGVKNVLLVFYPFAFSGICTGELCQVRDELAAYQNDDVQVIGVSVDTPFSLKAWAEKEGYTFPLLSDFWPHGQVARDYDVFNEKAGMAVRGTFLVDADGAIAFAEVNPPGDAREQTGWKDAVRTLTA